MPGFQGSGQRTPSRRGVQNAGFQGTGRPTPSRRGVQNAWFPRIRPAHPLKTGGTECLVSKGPAGPPPQDWGGQNAWFFQGSGRPTPSRLEGAECLVFQGSGRPTPRLGDRMPGLRKGRGEEEKVSSKIKLSTLTTQRINYPKKGRDTQNVTT